MVGGGQALGHGAGLLDQVEPGGAVGVEEGKEQILRAVGEGLDPDQGDLVERLGEEDAKLGHRAQVGEADRRRMRRIEVPSPQEPGMELPQRRALTGLAAVRVAQVRGPVDRGREREPARREQARRLADRPPPVGHAGRWYSGPSSSTTWQLPLAIGSSRVADARWTPSASTAGPPDPAARSHAQQSRRDVGQVQSTAATRQVLVVVPPADADVGHDRGRRHVAVQVAHG